MSARKKTAKPWARTKATARVVAAGGLDARWAEEKVAQVIAACHPDQRAFVQDPGRRVCGLVGRGGGKTTGGRARFVIRMLRTRRAKCVYIATTRQQAEDLMWGPLKDLLEKLGLRTGVDVTYNETKLRCTFKRNGSTLRLVGADNKREIDKLRGQSFHEVGIDEGASYPASLVDALIYRIIGPRLGDCDGMIWMIGTPGHVLAGTFYDATRPGSKLHRPWKDRERADYADFKGWSSHHWTLQDGARTVPALAKLWEEALREKETNGWSDSHPIWCREYLGQWAADDTENVFKYRPHLEGAEWNVWDPPRVGALKFAQLPDDVKGWEFGIGMDMGHADPFTVDVFAWSPFDPEKRVLHIYCFERLEMYALPIAHVLLGENLNHEHPGGVIGETGWPSEMVADGVMEGGSTLDELSNVYGIRIASAEKGYKYKFPAIETVNGMLIDGRLRILKGSKLELEMLTLQWVSDEYGRLKENKSQANHHTDGTIGIIRRIALKFGANVVTPPRGAARPPGPVLRDRGEPADDEPPADFAEMLASGAFDDGGEEF